VDSPLDGVFLRIALYDEDTDTWISDAEVAEIRFTAFASQKKTHHVAGRLVVRRILRPKKDHAQGALFDIWRFHAFFTTTDPGALHTVAADKTHRHLAIIEQVHADLKNSALAHLPSNSFSANAAWLGCAVMAFNLTRAVAILTGDPKLTKATTGTIRRTIVSVPARIAPRRSDWPCTYRSTGRGKQHGTTHSSILVLRDN